MKVKKRNGDLEPLDISKIHGHVEWACRDLPGVSQSTVETGAHIMFYDGISTEDIQRGIISAAADQITEESPNYTYVAARLTLQMIYKEVTGGGIEYPRLKDYIKEGVRESRLDPQMAEQFYLKRLNDAIKPDRDYELTYLGIQTLADRYLIRRQVRIGQERGQLIEMPQHFFMRVAMGLALNSKQEGDDEQIKQKRTDEAISFYHVLSKLEFVSSTPTLFNSGTNHPQMSSCYLNTVEDSVGELGSDYGIFNTIVENANLSKYAGGIGTDWTRVRPALSPIKSTNGVSSGVVPYLKIFNDTAIAVNQGGKRNGAFAAYLEPWHGDFRDFINLKKQAGDDRRRCHDIFPAGWIPDLFMRRVRDKGDWSFFGAPHHETLHGMWGSEFEEEYLRLEREGLALRKMPAMELWREWITSLAQTGAPWITFKDECNRRNPQQHRGMINNSNLCTEITLVTNDEETAVCNLGSINLSRHIDKDGDIDHWKLRKTIRVAVRMLDNVIDNNFYPSPKAKLSNSLNRPIGLGVMGLTELLVASNIDWESDENLDFQDWLFELISYHAILASTELAEERGKYPTYEGSLWSQGILPLDTARDARSTLDWGVVRARVAQFGMRNSNVMAIAPTATIANIAGTTPCVEPIFKRSYMKENKSGFFRVVDPSLRYGRPNLCKTAFEIDQEWIIKAAARRQKWIDQSQSVNIFRRVGMRGAEISDLYFKAWALGLKTTYYLRNEQKDETGGVVIKDTTHELPSLVENTEEEIPVVMCSIDNPDCESCQ